MKYYLIALVGVITLLAILTLNRGGQVIKPGFDRANAPMQITVYTYSSRSRLNAAHPDGKALRRRGWSLWYEDDPSECEIHVLEPFRVDDDIMSTWGHELAHCIYGTYHR